MLNLNGKLPHVVLGAIVIQTAGAIWWASGLTTTVNTQGDAIKELRASVNALTAAKVVKVVVLEAEVARLQAELISARARRTR